MWRATCERYQEQDLIELSSGSVILPWVAVKSRADELICQSVFAQRLVKLNGDQPSPQPENGE